MQTETINVTKISGENAPYNEEKLRHSLERSGAGETLIEEITTRINNLLYEGISTKEIYRKAFAMLKKQSRSSAARYKLKSAILELGPTGYPFEKFVGEILKHQGFKVRIGVKVEGYCVTHEVDVIAEKDVKHYIVECKFHNEQNKQFDVKVPLYINSRFEDLERSQKQQKGLEKIHQGWIFTNTRFSTDAIKYGQCVGLMMIGWDHPKHGSLKERIDLIGLHPVTSLTTITKKEKQDLLSREVVLCKHICKEPELLNYIGISRKRQERILWEAEELCKSNP